MKNASDAAAITPVAAQPQIAIARDTLKRPMTFGLRTISIITAISGAASTPLTIRNKRLVYPPDVCAPQATAPAVIPAFSFLV